MVISVKRELGYKRKVRVLNLLWDSSLNSSSRKIIKIPASIGSIKKKKKLTKSQKKKREGQNNQQKKKFNKHSNIQCYVAAKGI